MKIRLLDIVEAIPSLILGVAVAIWMQKVNGWWLNITPWPTVAVLFALALGLSIPIGSPLTRLVAMWFGAQIGFTWWLFAIEGGSNIFPIVIGVGAIMSGLGVITGGGLGSLLNYLISQKRDKVLK